MSWQKIGFEHIGIAAGIALAALVAGCGVQLETGYQFRPLNARPPNAAPTRCAGLHGRKIGRGSGKEGESLTGALARFSD